VFFPRGYDRSVSNARFCVYRDDFHTDAEINRGKASQECLASWQSILSLSKVHPTPFIRAVMIDRSF
jgi:predicted GNAT superfamily acetyltransferase